MAGETPEAVASRQRRAIRSNDRTANKYYASGDISALGNNVTVADSVLKPGETPVAVPTPVVQADDRSADKYYANAGSRLARGALAAKAQKSLGPPPKLGLPAPKAKPRNGLTVLDKNEINGVMAEVVEAIGAGTNPVVVYVKAGDSQLLRRARTALDLLITREVITEDQGRDVRFSYEPAGSAKAELDAVLGPPQPKTAVPVKTENNEAVGDPLDFLNSDPNAMTSVDTSPTPLVEVDTTNDTGSPPAVTESNEDDDGADNAFLDPDTPAVEAAVPEPEPPAPETPTKPESQKSRSRRYGRGVE